MGVKALRTLAAIALGFGTLGTLEGCTRGSSGSSGEDNNAPFAIPDGIVEESGTDPRNVTIEGNPAIRGTATFAIAVQLADPDRGFTIDVDIDGVERTQDLVPPDPGDRTNFKVFRLTVNSVAEPLADGMHTLKVVTTNTRGRSRTDELLFLVDNSTPKEQAVQPISVLSPDKVTQALNGFILTLVDDPADPGVENAGIDIERSKPTIRVLRTNDADGIPDLLTEGQHYVVDGRATEKNRTATIEVRFPVVDDGLYLIGGDAVDRVGNRTPYGESKQPGLGTFRSDVEGPLVVFEQPSAGAILPSGDVVVRAEDAQLQKLELFRMDPSQTPARLTSVVAVTFPATRTPPAIVPQGSGAVVSISDPGVLPERTTLTVSSSAVAATTPPAGSDGPILMLARATDFAGSISETRLDFALDPTSPVVTFSVPDTDDPTSVVPGIYLNDPGIVVTGAVTENLGLATLVFEAEVDLDATPADPDNQSLAPGLPLPVPANQASFTYTTPLILNEGVHTARARGVDRAGRMGVSTPDVTFVVDRTAPTIVPVGSIPLFLDRPAGAQPLTFSFDVADLHAFRSIEIAQARSGGSGALGTEAGEVALVGNGPPSGPTVDTALAFETQRVSVTYPAAGGLGSDGETFTITITAVDFAGNIATRTFSIVIEDDGTVPQITLSVPDTDDPGFPSSDVVPGIFTNEVAVLATGAVTENFGLQSLEFGADVDLDFTPTTDDNQLLTPGIPLPIPALGSSFGYATPIALNEGLYIAQVRGVDGTGNVGLSNTVTFTVDRTPASIVPFGAIPPSLDGAALASPVTISFDVTDLHGFRSIAIDQARSGGAGNLGTEAGEFGIANQVADVALAFETRRVSVTYPAKGGLNSNNETFTITITATDLAGNVTARSFTIVIEDDATDPQVTLVVPDTDDPGFPGSDTVPGIFTNDPTTLVTGAVTENFGTASLELTADVDLDSTPTTDDNLQLSPGIPLPLPATGPSFSYATPVALNEGVYDAQTRVIDGAGNTGLSNVVRFTVDRTAPAIAAVGTLPVSLNRAQLQSEVTVSFEVTDLHGLQSIAIDQTRSGGLGLLPVETGEITLATQVADVQLAVETRTVSVTFQDDGMLKANNEIFTIAITAKDLAGNVAVRTFAIVIDDVPPADLRITFPPATGPLANPQLAQRISADPVTIIGGFNATSLPAEGTLNDTIAFTFGLGIDFSIQRSYPDTVATGGPTLTRNMTLTVIDTLGNTSVLGRQFAADRTAPTVELAGDPFAKGITNDRNAVGDIEIAFDDNTFDLGDLIATITLENTVTRDPPVPPVSVSGPVSPNATAPFVVMRQLRSFFADFNAETAAVLDAQQFSGDPIKLTVRVHDQALPAPNEKVVTVTFTFDNEAPQLIESSIDGRYVNGTVGVNRRIILTFNEAVVADKATLVNALAIDPDPVQFTIPAPGSREYDVDDFAPDMMGSASKFLPNDTLFLVPPQLLAEDSAIDFDIGNITDLAGNTAIIPSFSDTVLSSDVVDDATGQELEQLAIVVDGTFFNFTAEEVFRDALLGTRGFLGATVPPSDTLTTNPGPGNVQVAFDFKDSDVNDTEDVDRILRLEVVDQRGLPVDCTVEIDEDVIFVRVFDGLEAGYRYRFAGEITDKDENLSRFELILTVAKPLQEPPVNGEPVVTAVGDFDGTPPSITSAFGTARRGPIWLGLSEGIALTQLQQQAPPLHFNLNANLNVLPRQILVTNANPQDLTAVPTFRVSYDHALRNALRLDPIGGPWPESVDIALGLQDLAGNSDAILVEDLRIPDDSVEARNDELPVRDGYFGAAFLRGEPAISRDLAGLALLPPVDEEPELGLVFSAPLHGPTFRFQALDDDSDGEFEHIIGNMRVFEDFHGTKIPLLEFRDLEPAITSALFFEENIDDFDKFPGPVLQYGVHEAPSPVRDQQVVGLEPVNGHDDLRFGATFSITINVDGTQGDGRVVDAIGREVEAIEVFFKANELDGNFFEVPNAPDARTIAYGIQQYFFGFPPTLTSSIGLYGTASLIDEGDGDAEEIFNPTVQGGLDLFLQQEPGIFEGFDFFNVGDLGSRDLSFNFAETQGLIESRFVRRPYLFQTPIPPEYFTNSEGGSFLPGEVEDDETTYFVEGPFNTEDQVRLRFGIFVVYSQDSFFDEGEGRSFPVGEPHEVVYSALAFYDAEFNEIQFTEPFDLRSNFLGGSNGEGQEFFFTFFVEAIDSNDGASVIQLDPASLFFSVGPR